MSPLCNHLALPHVEVGSHDDDLFHFFTLTKSGRGGNRTHSPSTFHGDTPFKPEIVGGILCRPPRQGAHRMYTPSTTQSLYGTETAKNGTDNRDVYQGGFPILCPPTTTHGGVIGPCRVTSSNLTWLLPWRAFVIEKMKPVEGFPHFSIKLTPLGSDPAHCGPSWTVSSHTLLFSGF